MSNQAKSHFTRRNFLKTSLAAATLAALPGTRRALAMQRESESGRKAARQAAKTIKVLALAWPSTATEQKLADETFTPDTGIKVELEALDYTFMEQRVKQLVSGKSDTYDIYHYDSQWLGGFVLGGALERLDTPDYLGNSKATIKFDDFHPEIAARLGRYPSVETALRTGKLDALKDVPIYGLPWSLNCEVLWYRKDIIKNVPETWDDLRKLAKQVTTKDYYGMAFHANRVADYITVEYLPLLWAFGGDLWDAEKWIANGYINGAPAVKALEFMRDMWKVDKSVDPASGGWGFNERLNALLQGKTAMAQNWAPLFGNLPEDPKSSAVVGKIGYAVVPKGPGGRWAMFGCQGTGINANSKNKAEAWMYEQWLLSKDTQSALLKTLSAGFISSRKDLADEAAKTSEWHKAFVDSIPIIRDFWNNGDYAELLDICARQLNLGYIDKVPAKKALDDAATAQQVVYDSSPENPKNKKK
jgi:ABC-type glycerol-3-phosphate transport system substrate-binding protein